MIDLPDLAAFAFDGRGGASPLLDAALSAPPPQDSAFVWVHLRRDAPGTAALLAESGLDPLAIEALTADETRPRCTVHDEGALLNLRGVNLAPGEEPEDMVSVRLWIEERRVIGVWLRPLAAAADMIEAAGRGKGPVSPGDLVAKLALRLADRAEPVVAELNERIDALEERMLEGDGPPPRRELADIRHTAIVLRRYMFPQRDALTTLEIEDLRWLQERDRARVREAAERVTRLAEELDAIRDRAQIVHDEIMDERGERMNRRMLLLSVVTAVFLPLGLITGLLGINVGGIPGAGDPNAFLVVCGLLGVVVAIQIAIFVTFRILR